MRDESVTVFAAGYLRKYVAWYRRKHSHQSWDRTWPKGRMGEWSIPAPPETRWRFLKDRTGRGRPWCWQTWTPPYSGQTLLMRKNQQKQNLWWHAWVVQSKKTLLWRERKWKRCSLLVTSRDHAALEAGGWRLYICSEQEGRENTRPGTTRGRDRDGEKQRKRERAMRAAYCWVGVQDRVHFKTAIK